MTERIDDVIEELKKTFGEQIEFELIDVEDHPPGQTKVFQVKVTVTDPNHMHFYEFVDEPNNWHVQCACGKRPEID